MNERAEHMIGNACPAHVAYFRKCLDDTQERTCLVTNHDCLAHIHARLKPYQCISRIDSVCLQAIHDDIGFATCDLPN